MPLLEVTGGPTPPSGRTLAAGTRLAVRFDEPYADGVSVYATLHLAEYDFTNSRWKPEGAADGVSFYIPGGATGQPQPTVCWLVELQTLDDLSTVSNRRGPFRIYETSIGVWAYGTPAPGTLVITNPDVAGIVDHGALTGLVDDDHTQYQTDARADTWWGTKAASQVESEAGTEVALRAFSPLRVKQAIDALAPAGGGSGAGLTGPIESLAWPTTSVLDWNTSVFKVITISGNTTATFANLPAAGTHDEMHLRIVQDATGGWEVTWPVEVDWLQGEPPNMADIEPNEELFVSFQIDDGAVVTGSHNLLPRINYQTGTLYTIAPTDDGKEVRLSNLNPITLTVETEATMGFIPNGYAVGFTWWGAGSVTVVAGTGVTIERRADLTAVLHSQYASGLLRYYGNEHWLLSGELAAV